MKKLLSVVIVIFMVAALCLSASATLNIDRIFIDHNVMAGGEDVKGNDPIEIAVGQKLYTLGWAANAGGALTEIVYTIDDGPEQKCSDSYRDRADVASAGIAIADNGAHGGFGDDNNGLLELTGIDQLTDGTYKLTIKALYANGESDSKVYNLKVGNGGENAPADAKYPFTAGDGGIGVWLNEGTPSVSVKFTTAGSFKAISFKSQYWASCIATTTGSEADWKVELYKFAYNTENTLEQAPVQSTSIHSTADNTPVFSFEFDEQEAGTYIVVITITNPTYEEEVGGAMKKPYVVLPEITNPDAAKFEFSGKAFNLNITGAAVDGDFFLANPEETEVPVEPYYIWNHNGEANLADPFNDTTRVGFDSALTADIRFKTDVSFKGILFPMIWGTAHAILTVEMLSGDDVVYAGQTELFNEAANSGDVPNVEFDFGEALAAGEYTLRVSVPEEYYAFFAYGSDPLSAEYVEFERGHMMFGLSTTEEGEGFVKLAGEEPVEVTLGDVNGDGKVNNKDVIALFKYASDEEVPDFVVEAADVNEDGKINNKDVFKLFKIVSEIPPEVEDTYLRHSLDRLMIGGADVSGEEAAVMKAGTEITILGWVVFTDGLKEMAYEIDGERFACEDNYRDRADVANAFGYPAEYGNHCGFGADTKFMSCTGTDALEEGEYELSIIAISNNGCEQVIKTITVTVSDEEPPAVPAITKTCVDGAPTNNGIFSPGGWTGANYKITKFGYTVDGGEPIFDHIRLQELDASDPVKLDANAGPNGVRFFADIPLNELTAEDHVIKLVCQVEDVDETVLELGRTATFTVQGTLPVPPSVKVVVEGEAEQADVTPSNTELSMNDGNLVVKTTGGDPWFAVAVPDIAVDEYESFVIKFRTNSAIGGNNTYLADGNLNFTGEQGAWMPHGMGGMEDGEWHEVTYKLADFPYFAGKTLKFIRFTAVAAEGETMEVQSITFYKAGEQPVVIDLFGYSADWYAYAGAFLSQSGNCDKLVKENPQTYELHSDPNSDIVGFYGWAALNNSKITTFGIKIDGGEMIDSPLARIQSASLDRTAELANAGIVNGEAFWTVFFYTSAGAGKHNVAIYAIDELGGEHELFNYDYEAVSVDPPQWLCDTTNTGVLLPGLWAFPATPGQYCTLTFTSAYTFNGFCMMIYGNPEGTVVDVSLLDKYGTELEKQQFTQVGDAAPTIVFSKAYPEGTYTLKFTIVSGAGETNWFVIGTGDPNPAMPVTVGGNFATNENTRAGIYAFLTGAPHITVASLKSMSFDNIILDGENKTPTGNAGAWIEANPIDSGVSAIGVRGWAWVQNGTIGQFGYSIDGAAPVFADEYLEQRPDVQAAFGVTADDANGFSISNINIADLTGGDHTFTVVVKAADGTIIDVTSFKFHRDYSLLNVSYDTLTYDENVLVNGGADKWIHSLEDKSVLDFGKGAVKTITVRGWVRISQNTADIKGFGYSIDGGEIVQGAFLEDRPDLAPAGFPGGVGFAVAVPVEALEIGQHSIDTYLFAADGTVIKIVKDRSTAETVDIRQVGVTFNVIDAAQVATVEALYALGDNEDLPDGPHTLTGVITEVVTAYSERYENVTVDIEIAGAEGKLVRCYRIKGEGADQIDVGDTITVTGELTHFVNSNNNVFEFKANSTIDSWTASLK